MIRDVPDNRFACAACIVANVRIAAQLLETVSIDKVANFIVHGPSSDVMAGLEALSKVAYFQPAVEQRVNKLTFDELADAISAHGLKSVSSNRALQFLSEVRSWDRANEVFTNLVLPIFSSLTKADIERVIRMPTENGADLPCAHGLRLFVDAIKRETIFDEVSLNALLAANDAGYLVPQPRAV